MTSNRLSSETRVHGLIRQLNIAGAEAYQLRRGDDTRGSILVQLEQADGISSFVPRADIEGHTSWHALSPPVDKFMAQQQLDKKLRLDSDLWVVDVYDPKGLIDLHDAIYRAYL